MRQRKASGISREEELALIRLAKDELAPPLKRKAAVAKLIKVHTPFIGNVLKEFTLPVWVSQEDVMQEGIIGMIDAIERFDVDSGNRFLTYAYWRIKKTIIGHLSEMAYSMKVPFPDVLKLKRTVNRMDLGTSEDPEADAKTVGLSKNRNIQSILQGCLPISPTEFQSAAHEDDWVSQAVMAQLVSKDTAESVIGAIIKDEIVNKMSELSVLEGYMLGMHMGLYVSETPTPLKYIAGEKSRVTRKGDEQVVTSGWNGFGLETGESYNNCSKLIKQAEGKFKHELLDFLDQNLRDDYLER